MQVSGFEDQMSRTFFVSMTRRFVVAIGSIGIGSGTKAPALFNADNNGIPVRAAADHGPPSSLENVSNLPEKSLAALLAVSNRPDRPDHKAQSTSRYSGVMD